MKTKKIAQKQSQVGGKKKSVPLTPKQTKYVRERLKGKTKKRAALDAGYTESMACAATSRNQQNNQTIKEDVKGTWVKH